MNDKPKLDGYTFERNPGYMDVHWEPQIITHQLADGQIVRSNKGFILKGVLQWGEGGWLTKTDQSAILTMYTDLTASAKFYPRPQTNPARFFSVQIINPLDISLFQGNYAGGTPRYQGSLVFTSSEGDMTSTPTDIF